MKKCIATVLPLAVMLVGLRVNAEESACSEDVAWRDAVYAQRTTSSAGHYLSATVERYSNAQLVEIDADGEKAVFITVPGAGGGEAIAFAYGAKRPAPDDFAEIVLAIEPPMVDGSWRRFQRPCMIADGSRMAFDERDFPAGVGAAASIAPAFHGVLTRRGLEFDYALTIMNDGSTRPEAWNGKLRYGAPVRGFDLATDVQGWHVFRGRIFVTTLPLGQPIPLSAILDSMRDRSIPGR